MQSVQITAELLARGIDQQSHSSGVATMRTGASKIRLDPSVKSHETVSFEEELHHRIIGQDQAITALTSIYQMYLAGMAPATKPVANILLAGPTGTGKTRLVEAAAEILFQSPQALIKIDCGEFQHGHEIAKITGSPPGYLGHRETSPLITPETLNQFRNPKNNFTIILFDEIEKSSDVLWNLLLGILDKGSLSLGDNRKVNMCSCMIFLTTNLGAREVQSHLSGNGIVGFQKPSYRDSSAEKSGGQKSEGEKSLDAISMKAISRKFTPEFMNRIDKTIMFNPLDRASCIEIVRLEIGAIQDRVLKAVDKKSGSYFAISCKESAINFLVDTGISAQYGARNIKRAIEQHVTDPLARIMASHQVPENPPSVVIIEKEKNSNGLSFFCEPIR